MGSDNLFILTLINNFCICLEAWEFAKFLRHFISHIVDWPDIDVFLNILAAWDFDVVFWLGKQIKEIEHLIYAGEYVRRAFPACILSVSSASHIFIIAVISSWVNTCGRQ